MRLAGNVPFPRKSNLVGISICIILWLAFMPPICLAIAVASDDLDRNRMSYPTIISATGWCMYDAAELDRLAASLAALGLNYCNLQANQNGNPRAAEPIAQPLAFPNLR
jgi:hypothetical protein